MVAISHVLPEILADGSAQTNTWLETLRAYYRPDEMQQLAQRALLCDSATAVRDLVE